MGVSLSGILSSPLGHDRTVKMLHSITSCTPPPGTDDPSGSPSAQRWEAEPSFPAIFARTIFARWTTWWNVLAVPPTSLDPRRFARARIASAAPSDASLSCFWCSPTRRLILAFLYQPQTLLFFNLPPGLTLFADALAV